MPCITRIGIGIMAAAQLMAQDPTALLGLSQQLRQESSSGQGTTSPTSPLSALGLDSSSRDTAMRLMERTEAGSTNLQETIQNERIER